MFRDFIMYSILRASLVLGLAYSLPALALPPCDYDFDGADCGNGVFPCGSGYLINCTGACVPSGGCSVYCTQCNCIPGYRPADSLSVAHNTATDIIAYCQCKNVNNTHASGKALLVPLKTSTEWSAFYNNPPAGVTVSPGSCF